MKPGNERGYAKRRERLSTDPDYARLLQEQREQRAIARRDDTPEPPTFRRSKGGEVVYSEETAIEVRLRASQRAARAAEMKVHRFSWETIARELGYKSADVARKTVERYIQRLPRESMEALRALELEGLDRAESALADHIRQGDPQAINSMLKIKHHRARLMGLYAKGSSLADVDIELVMVQTTTEVVHLVKTYPDMTVEQVITELLHVE